MQAAGAVGVLLTDTQPEGYFAMAKDRDPAVALRIPMAGVPLTTGRWGKCGGRCGGEW